MVFIGMGWFLLDCYSGGVVRGPPPTSPGCEGFRKERFFGILTRSLVVFGVEKSPYFDYPTMLGASGGLAPSFYWSPAFLKNPQKVAVIENFVFFRKKSWAKMAILSPGPNVDRSRSGGRGPVAATSGCRFPAFFSFFFWSFTFFFFQNKYRF